MTTDLSSSHLSRVRYGDFTLTDAIRPGAGVPIRPRQGYRVDIYRDRQAGLRLPMLSASVSKELLFDAFLALIEPLGEDVHVVLETSHDSRRDYPLEFRRHHVDTPVLASHLCEFEDLLLNDGCTGVAVMSPSQMAEVQFDEHKLLHVYAPDLKPYRMALKALGIHKREVLPLISEGEHLHHTTEDYADCFHQFCNWVGVVDYDEVMSEE